MATRRIAILGTGSMGGAIAEALVTRTQHQLAVRGSTRDSASAAALADRLGLKLATDEDVAASDIVFAVVPPTAIDQVAKTLADYRGIVIALIVDGTVGFDGNKSAAEQLAEALPNARVAGAFTSLWDAVVRNPGTSGKTSIFVFSDDEEARRTVMELAAELGFDPINGGKVKYALYGEVMGMLVATLAKESGYGKTISFRAFKAE